MGTSLIKHFLEDPTVTSHTQGKTHVFSSLDPAVLLDPVSHCHNSLLHKPKALCTAAFQAQLTAVRAELGELSPAPGEGRWPDRLLFRSCQVRLQSRGQAEEITSSPSTESSQVWPSRASSCSPYCLLDVSSPVPVHAHHQKAALQGDGHSIQAPFWPG